MRICSSVPPSTTIRESNFSHVSRPRCFVCLSLNPSSLLELQIGSIAGTLALTFLCKRLVMAVFPRSIVSKRLIELDDEIVEEILTMVAKPVIVYPAAHLTGHRVDLYLTVTIIAVDDEP